MKTTISEKGQVTIPKKLRVQLGLEPGVILDFSEENGRLIASKRVNSSPGNKWRGAGNLPIGKDTAGYLKIIRER